MKNRCLIFIFFALLPALLGAQALSEEEAASRALGALASHEGFAAPANPRALHLVYSMRTRADKPAVYVFSQPQGGLIFASADRRLRPVLGYTDAPAAEGESLDALPENMKAWLQTYADDLAALDDNPHMSAVVPSDHGFLYEPAPADKPEVRPLLGVISWDQNPPYNNDCPSLKTTSGQKMPSYAGCSAIAAAQILAYYKYPERGIGQKSYTTQTYAFEESVDFASHTYDWDNILPSYRKGYTKVEANAVAMLVHDVGVAIEMDYAPQGSSAFNSNVVSGLINHFGYNGALTVLSREVYTLAQWEAIIRGELSSGRPCMMTGTNDRGGHAFVCDGYNADGLYHFNWGWSGWSDGFFAITALDPEMQGAGGSAAGYNDNQGLIVGFMPDQGEGATTLPELMLLGGTNAPVVDADTDVEGAPRVICHAYNSGYQTFEGDACIRVFEGDEMRYDGADDVQPDMTVKPGYSGFLRWTVPAEYRRAGLRYEFWQRVKGQTDWQQMLAPVGQPQSIVSQTDESGKVIYLPNPDELTCLTVAAVEPVGKLFAGQKGYFRVTLANDSKAECHSQLLMSNAAGSSMNDYKVVSVPAGEAVTVEVGVTLPKTVGVCKYQFYRRDTDSHLRYIRLSDKTSGKPEEYGFDILNVDGESAPAFTTKNFKLKSSSTVFYEGSLVEASATLRNDGGYGVVEVLTWVFSMPSTEAVEYFGYSKVGLAGGEMKPYNVAFPIYNYTPGKYGLSLQVYPVNNPQAGSEIARLYFSVREGSDGVREVVFDPSESDARFSISGLRLRDCDRPSGVIVEGGRKMLTR